MNLTDAQKRKLRATFDVTKRDPTDRESAWDMRCTSCGFRSSGWSKKQLALQAGYAHATKDHAAGILPLFSGLMREMLS